MFDFRIIEIEDGRQIIDMRIKTPYESLTPLQMVEYTEMDAQLAIMDRMKRKIRREEERKRKTARNLLYRILCLD